MDIAQGTNKEYKVTVEWKDDQKTIAGNAGRYY